jgi:hypothetical protein
MAFRMPNKWHASIEGQRREQKDNAAAYFYVLHYLAPLLSAFEGAGYRLPSVVSRGRSQELLWADSIDQKFEEGLSNSGLFASERSKTFPRRLLKSIGRDEFKHRCQH